MIKAVGPARPSVRQTVITGAFIFLPHLFFVFFFFFLGGFSTQTLRHCNADLGRNVRAVAATADDRVRLDRNLHPFDRFRLRFSFLFFSLVRGHGRNARNNKKKSDGEEVVFLRLRLTWVVGGRVWRVSFALCAPSFRATAIDNVRIC